MGIPCLMDNMSTQKERIACKSDTKVNMRCTTSNKLLESDEMQYFGVPNLKGGNQVIGCRDQVDQMYGIQRTVQVEYMYQRCP